MVPVTLPSLLDLSLRGVQDLTCLFSIKAVSHMAQVSMVSWYIAGVDGGISDIASSVSHLVQENRRWREKANEGIVGCSEEEEDEIKVTIS